jgi:hypothetical protein
METVDQTEIDFNNNTLLTIKNTQLQQGLFWKCQRCYGIQ